nr:YihY/virulence factor BrkB family protein [uncultured Blautia sp.]
MDKKKEKQSVFQLLLGFMDRAMGDHVGAYAAQAAYFLIMSFIPFILFLTTMIRYTPLTYNMVSETIRAFVPHNIQNFVLTIVSEVYGRSIAVVPITAIMALWSAGKAMQSLTNGLNTIYHVKETRNWLVTRLYAVVYTFMFGLAIIASLLMLVLGNQIQNVAGQYVPILGKVIGRITGARTALVFAGLFLVFLILYKMLPNRKATFKSQVPGAILIAAGWSLFSYFFSIYFDMFPGFSNMYGSLTALIMVMLWLYICMNLLLYGAEINAYFEKQFRMAQASMREMLSREHDEAEREHEKGKKNDSEKEPAKKKKTIQNTPDDKEMKEE